MPKRLASSVIIVGLANSNAFSKSIKTTIDGLLVVENLGLLIFSVRVINASRVPLF